MLVNLDFAQIFTGLDENQLHEVVKLVHTERERRQEAADRAGITSIAQACDELECMATLEKTWNEAKIERIRELLLEGTKDFGPKNKALVDKVIEIAGDMSNISSELQNPKEDEEDELERSHKRLYDKLKAALKKWGYDPK